ncbi:trimeric intracellular cation channel family protein [Halalkalicoccus sp. NIPERK01]|uniref:trimeric intracellular cation channel family protein n=1 Tax=Halalkalicoccus sp. NIPERK01 TaxID=3053469 RepID=UPI00256F1402|nr:TRIC cation channel family protein [Halalkalicoccus sp. NIPERK01]MDL5360478.1 TRIC cation channel family protein [Halalkalicoccus sp. NIPERK01]
MNAIGLVAFALVGAAKAIRERFDLFGVVVVGLATAFAGGATRDVLVNRAPLVLSSPGEIALGLFGVSLAVGLSAALESPDDHPVTLVSDAVGLGAFATAGSIVAADAGLPGFGIVVVATINAVGGGACADVLLDRPPFILLTDFYASCAVLGGGVFWTVTAVGGAESIATALCAAVTVGTRLAAVAYGWELPTAQRVGQALTWPRTERGR